MHGATMKITGMYCAMSLQDELNWFYEVIVVSIVCYEELQHIIVLWRGTRWRSWLRHWATSRKVAGSIPDGVIGNVH